MGYELMRPQFERMLNILRQKTPRAGAWLDQIPKEKWSQAYDQGRRYGHMTTNLAECINGVLKGSRTLPFTALVKATYYRLNEWFIEHRNEASNMIKAGHVYCEELTKVIKENQRQSTCQLVRTFSRETGVSEVEVVSRSGGRQVRVYTVRLADNCWGSAVLACLYRGLCRAAIISDQKEIGGCLILLQSWAYDHIPMLAPRLQDPTLPFYPLFLWTPYIQMTFLPNVVEICRSRVPLICFAIVEWHAPVRVMRQFGMDQSIPQDPVDCAKLHKIDLRGKSDYNWPHKHRRWIQMWNDRENYVVNGLPNTVLMLHHYSQYMQWYLPRTRRYISREGSYPAGMYTFAKRICDQSAPPTSLVNLVQSLSNVYSTGREMMEALATINPTAYSTNYFEAPPTQHIHMPQTESPQQSPQQTHFKYTIIGIRFSTILSSYYAANKYFHIQHTDDEVVVEDDDDEDESEDEDEEEEEQPQLVTRARGRILQRNEQQLRVQPPRRRKPPPCGTSSHRRH
ncbi:hypothetical protein Lal_00036447 [Lupinus albus]|nr:hypothetical protein Lal_00036447 [Lupinus albus]